MTETTVIQLKRKTRDRLKAHGKKGETYNDIINNLCQFAEDFKY